MKRSLLLLLLLATTTTAHAATEADTAKKKAEALPGLKLMSGLSVTSASPGYTISGISSTDLSATVFKTDAGWHGSLELGTPSTFAFDELANLGSATLSSVLFVVSEKADQIPNDKLPTSIRADLAEFQVGGKLAVDAGVNLFVTAKAGDTGLLGQLKQALGLGDGGIRIRALIGESAFKRALGSATSSAAAADPVKLSISVTLPKLYPMGINDKPTRFEVTTSTLTWTKNGSSPTISGSLTGALTLNSKAAAFTGTLAATGTGTTQTLTLDATADLAVTSLFGIEGVDLTKVAGSLVTNSKGATEIALKLNVNVGGSAYTARLNTLMDGAALRELSIAVDGTFKLAALKTAFGEDVAITNPSIGMLYRGGLGGFVGGTVKWRGFNSTTVVYVTGDGVAAFVKLGNIDMAKVLKRTDTLVKLDKMIAVASSVDMGMVRLSSLPSAARKMIDELGAAKLPAGVGLSVLGKLSLGTKGEALGISGDFIVGGSVGPDNFALYADLPSFTLPSAVQGAGLPSNIKPKVYVALRADGSFELGVDVRLTFKLESSRSLDADGRFYVAFGQAGGTITVAGALRSDWVDPFGLAGITIGANTAVKLTAATDGSLKVMTTGSAKFGTKTIELGGGLSVLFSSGVPAVKGFAFRFAATELGLTTPIELGQVLIRAAAAAIDKKTLSKAVGDGLTAAAKLDLVATMKSAMPETTLTTFGAALKLKNPLLFVATPGMGGGDPDFAAFEDAGVQVKGTLVLGSKQLGNVDMFATILKGFQVKASVADFSLGDLAITGAKIDLGAGIPGLHDVAPHFLIAGTATLGGKKLGAVDVEISATTLRVKGSLSVFGSSVSIAGEMTSKTEYSLEGTAKLDIPGKGEVAGVKVKLGTGGVSLSASASYAGVAFSLKGSYKSTSDWSISGTVNADVTHTIDLATGDIDVRVKGSVTWSLSDGGASIKFKGKAWATVASVYTEVALDEKVSTSGKITFDFLVYKPTVDVLP